MTKAELCFGRTDVNGIESPGIKGPWRIPVITNPGFVLLRAYPTPPTQRRELRSLGSGGISQLWCNSSFQISDPQVNTILKLSRLGLMGLVGESLHHRTM